MFRLVKLQDSGEPAFFLLCDHRQCLEARRGTANVANSEEYQLTKKQFLQTAIKEGWWIDLEGAFCPAHARDMLHMAKQEEKEKQTVVAAGPAELLAFGKSR